MTFWPFAGPYAAVNSAREPRGFMGTNDPKCNCFTCKHCTHISNQYFNCDLEFENEVLGFCFREDPITQVCDSWEQFHEPKDT